MDTTTLQGGSNDSNTLSLTFNDPNRETIMRAIFKINSSKPSQGILRFKKPSNFDWLTFFKGKQKPAEAEVLHVPSTWKVEKVE